MSKPSLTATRLLQSSFQEVGCWELNSARDLVHRIDLPKQPGVYAFAINGVVQYVGLASKSISQRLGFYRKPGASQRTNVRLNEIIRGHLEKGTVVQILIGHPPDHEWQGCTIKGPEGLEAGIIEEFDLPWNMRGSQTNLQVRGAAQMKFSSRTTKSGVSEQVLEIVIRRPGMTELEIAKAIYGPGAVQQRVNQRCRTLLAQGLVQRRGTGGVSDPFIYYPSR